MLEYFLVEKVISTDQHGFVPGRSAITNMLHCVNDWSRSLDGKEPADIIYLAFAKAFDKVPKRKLLH